MNLARAFDMTYISPEAWRKYLFVFAKDNNFY